MAHGPAGQLLQTILKIPGGVTAPAITPAASTQTQTAEGPITLTPHAPVGSLTVDGSVQTQTAATITLTAHNVYTLTVVDGSVQTQTAASVSFGGAQFPAAVAAGSRYLVNGVGQPWLAVGDTAWSIVGQLTNAQITQYLDNRAAKGINLVLFSAPEAYYAQNAPNNIDGVAPFTGTPFQSPLNNTYWNRVDFMVAQAATRGITCLIVPFYIGYDVSGPDAAGTDGWAGAVLAASTAQMRTYAGNIHARYGTAPNVMWLIGHDRVPGTNLMARASAFVDELRVVRGNTQLLAYGGWHPRDVGGTDTFGFGSEDWSTVATSYPPTFDTHYDYSEQIAVNADTMWTKSPTRPFLFFEGAYEQENPTGTGTVPVGGVLLREQTWAAWAGGAFGVIFGNNPIWHFESGKGIFPFTGTWPTNMDAAGSNHLATFATITATQLTGWQNTAADTTSTFVTARGSGTDRVAARFSTSLGVVYHPNFASGTITLDLTEFTSRPNVKISRIDPASGAVTVITPAQATTNPAYAISAPAANSVGARDWVFVVRSVAGGIKIGATDISAIKVGTTNVSKVMIGSTQAWP